MENNLTIEQIQAVIDKGGCLISDENEIHFGKMSIDGQLLTYQSSKSLTSGFEFGEGLYLIEYYKWREATPEEIEKYVPVEYRPKNMITDFIGGMNNNMKTHDVQFISPNSYKVKFFAVDPDSLRSDIVPEKQYTEADLVSFGNYLLSKEREEMITSKPERGIAECAVVIRQVSHADVENWRAKQ